MDNTPKSLADKCLLSSRSSSQDEKDLSQFQWEHPQVLSRVSRVSNPPHKSDAGFDVDCDEEDFTANDLYVDKEAEHAMLELMHEIDMEAENPLTEEQTEMVLNQPKKLHRAPIVF